MENAPQQEQKDEITVDEPIKKKLKSNTERKSVLDFRKYTKQIWLAGLGAFSRAEEEGNKLFDSLVKVGEELESKTSDIADQTVEKVSSKAKEQVVDTKDKVEKILDQSVNQSINKLGFATTKDVQQLEKLILQLQQKVDHLIEQHNKNNDKS
jgi:poly(hydroxyalkanoate) granule-associated protein